tara:strand:- start:879 stop:1070 length:192 start_codon:yes stop_codon:yes gene_type:complete
MRLNKYGKKKCMIDNGDGTYCFLNVSFFEVIKFYISSKLTGNMIKESKDAEKKSYRPEDMDGR